MCDLCNVSGLSRRGLLSLAGAGIALAAGGFAAQAAGGPTTSLSADEALKALKDGNAKYVGNPEMCTLDMAKKRSKGVEGQAPWAIILGCADSRVPPELLFGGLSVGELFVTRNAGNIVNTDVLGTIEYGVAVLGAPLIVVLGHEKCGAVAAACDVFDKGTALPGSIGPMVDVIVPAAAKAKAKGGDFIETTVRENAQRGAAQILARSPIVAEAVKAGKVKVVAARYALSDGKVEFLA